MTNQTKQPNQKPTPIEEIISLQEKGLTVRQIAKIAGVTHSRIVQRLTAHKAGTPQDTEILKAFKDNKADIFAQKQMELVSEMTAEKQKKMSGSQLAVAAGIFHDKETMIRDKEGADKMGISQLHGNADIIRKLEIRLTEILPKGGLDQLREEIEGDITDV